MIQHCAEQYTTNTSLLEASQPDAILAYELDGEPLPLRHGGPPADNGFADAAPER